MRLSSEELGNRLQTPTLIGCIFLMNLRRETFPPAFADLAAMSRAFDYDRFFYFLSTLRVTTVAVLPSFLRGALSLEPNCVPPSAEPRIIDRDSRPGQPVGPSFDWSSTVPAAFAWFLAEPRIIDRILHPVAASKRFNLSRRRLLARPLRAGCRQVSLRLCHGAAPLRNFRHGGAACRQTTRGSDRKRLPVRANSAFATAAASGGTPGSPTPVGGNTLATSHVSTAGARASRTSG